MHFIFDEFDETSQSRNDEDVKVTSHWSIKKRNDICITIL